VSVSSQAIAAIIPCYNGAAFLGAAIESVLAQTRPVARLIVVDDGSIDDSVAIAEGYSSRGYPVTCIRTFRNFGVAEARNVGLRAVSEPFVAFLDCDDMWLDVHCAEVASLLDRYPETVLASGSAKWLHNAASEFESALPNDEPFDAFWDLLFTNVVTQSAAIVRRTAVLDAGGYDQGLRYSEDFDLWLRLAHHGPFVTTRLVTCIRREHDGRLTKAQMGMYLAAWASRRRALEDLRNRGVGTAELERANERLGAAYDLDLSSVWRSRDRALVQLVLDAGREVDVPPIRLRYRQWRRRLRYYWPLWRTAAAVWDLAMWLPRQRWGTWGFASETKS
jgi:glycosyltransferase involved in cell wall biosynthesis